MPAGLLFAHGFSHFGRHALRSNKYRHSMFAFFSRPLPFVLRATLLPARPLGLRQCSRLAAAAPFLAPTPRSPLCLACSRHPRTPATCLRTMAIASTHPSQSTTTTACTPATSTNSPTSRGTRTIPAMLAEWRNHTLTLKRPPLAPRRTRTALHSARLQPIRNTLTTPSFPISRLLAHTTFQTRLAKRPASHRPHTLRAP